MTDVARRAGVSHQTVSRVLNGSPLVRDDTRDRVLAAVSSLGYRRNPAARALASKRSGVIGILAMETTLYGPGETLYGVERAARRAEFFVSIAAISGPSTSEVAEAVERLVAQQAEAIVAIAPLGIAPDALSSLPAEVPLVLTQGGLPGRATVGVDQVGGAYSATRHLIEAGASEVWHLAGPPRWKESAQRIAGWRRALDEAGLRAPEPLRGDWSPGSGHVLGSSLASAPPDGVFVANDHMALGLLRAFHEEGIRVPEDVLVAGFDDIPEAAFLTPPLTTVQQDFLAIGELAIAQALRLLNSSEGPQDVLVPAELKIRRSSTKQ